MKSTNKGIEQEKLLDQEEIIDFYYIDKESHTKILVHDKRKVKVALMEMEEYERKQKNDIASFECPYNPKTDDIIDKQNDIEDFEYEQTEFERDLESALQEVVDKITQDKENSEKIKKIIINVLNELTHKQLITIFLYYYLNFTEQEIGDYLHVTRQRIHTQINRINKKLFKNSQ